MKKKKELIIVVALALLLLLGVVVVLFVTGGVKPLGKATFATHTEYEVFQGIPVMKGEHITFTEARDVGSDNYMLYAENTTKEDYDNYLSILEEKEFKKYVDNGKDGIEGDVYAAYYQKDNLTVQVCHFVNLHKTMINASFDEVMSPNLFYQDTYVEANIEGMKTTLHSPELYNVGNSFIFQLKNGHFIVNDGGTEAELPYLLDYLESLAPQGEKPVVDLWVISHAHLDHMGVLKAISNKPSDLSRIYVENVFFNEPNEASLKTPAGLYDNPGAIVTISKTASAYLKSTDGDGPTVYRPRVGDHYFFNDITIDVIYSQELIDSPEWDTWNSSTTVLVYNIEGQKVLITGDADLDCQKFYMDMFDSTYFDIDIYQAAHHGKNIFNAFTNHCAYIGTVLYPTYKLGSASPEGNFAGRAMQNEYLKSKAKEAITYAYGTKVLTFPYEIGTSITLPETEWKYNNNTIPKWKETIKQ